MSKKTVLNLGCGHSGKEIIHHLFKGPDWKQLTVDINPETKPDVIDDIVTLKTFSSGTNYDGIFSSHSLEHLQIDDGFKALCRWRELLFCNAFQGTGLLIIVCPDLKAAAQNIVDDLPFKPLYISQAGSINALDVIYGYRGFTAENPLMGHRMGYTKNILERMLLEAGYSSVNVVEDKAAFELVAYARN